MFYKCLSWNMEYILKIHKILRPLQNSVRTCLLLDVFRGKGDNFVQTLCPWFNLTSFNNLRQLFVKDKEYIILIFVFK